MNSQDTKHYSPKEARPKAKAKAKAKSKAKAAAKAHAKHGAAADGGLKSRKSCAYHKAKAIAIKEGCSKEEAATRAKQATWLNP